MRETLVVLVSGRGALATLAGVPSVARHVQAGLTLGFDVFVVYPPERRALGAEIRGLIDAGASCLPADQFADLFAEQFLASEETLRSTHLVVAAEWYLSMTAIAAVRENAAARVFGRVCERGCISVPIARVTREETAKVALQLGTMSSAAALALLLDPSSTIIDLDSRSEQRLSDNVSTTHAEGKLVENLFGPQRLLPVLRLRPTLAPLLARVFLATALRPAEISAIKLVIGLGAAWIIEGGSYAEGFAGALLYFVARLIGAAGIVMARAGFADSDIREKLDLAGDTVLHVALLWSLAGGPARGNGAATLAAIATTGVLISTGIAYVFVRKETHEARRRAVAGSGGETREGATGHTPSVRAAAGDEFISRFVQRDGIAYALLFAAAAGQLDLFLWAAALASHLFYILWLLIRSRREDGTMAFGRPA